MKRSSFLKTLSTIIFAPSIISNIEELKPTPVEVKDIVPPVKYLDERLRVGDLVMFKNGQHARVQSMSMGIPDFRSLRYEELTDTSSYVIMGSAFQEQK